MSAGCSKLATHEFSDDRPAFTVFTMELIAGETLQKRIETRGSLSPAEAFPLIAQIADGLHAAHQAGIIHGDFESGNILLAGNRAVITDFGLARAELSEGPAAGGRTSGTGSQLAGTIAYMSPEQMSGAALTPASDTYAFGVVLFEMATGRLPFDGRNIIRSAVQRASGTRIPVRTLAPQIPRRWETAIARCMDREPGRRPRNLAKVAEQFRHERSLQRAPSRLALLLRRPATLAAAVALLVAVSLLLVIPRLYRGALKEGSEIIVTPTVNATGERKFDGLTAALRISAGQSSRFVSWDTARLPTLLKYAARPARSS
jgi:serine/threonine protein kinase